MSILYILFISFPRMLLIQNNLKKSFYLQYNIITTYMKLFTTIIILELSTIIIIIQYGLVCDLYF